MAPGYRPLHRRIPRPKVVRRVLTWSLVAALGVVTVNVVQQDPDVSAVSATTPQGGRHYIKVTAGDLHGAGHNGGISRLKGAKFGAFNANGRSGAFSSAPTGTPVGQCTTDADGECTIDVPERSGSTKGYVTRLIEAPAGYQQMAGAAGRLGLSRDGFDADVIRHYQFWTDGAGTDAVPNDNGTDDRDNYGTSTDEYVVPRVNPSLAPKCGLNVGLLVDLSSSVAQNATTSQLRGALNAFRDSLRNTDSRIALHTFGSSSPVSRYTHLPLTAVDSSVLTQRIDAISATGNGTQYTDWDEGLRSFQGMAEDGTAELDSVIVLTDGLPTAYDTYTPGGGNGSARTRPIELQHAMAASNALKAKDVKVISVGIGGATATAEGALNLAKISGTEPGDYFQLSKGYSDLEKFLRDMAAKACEGTVHVTKKVIPEDKTGVQNAVKAGGWTMNAATAPDKAVRLDGSNDAWGTAASGTTGADTGSVGFRLDVPANGSRDVTIAEVQKADHQLVRLAANSANSGQRNAQCWVEDDKGERAYRKVTDQGALGFKVAVGHGDKVLCEIVNQAVKKKANLKVSKTWKLDLDGNGTIDRTIADSATAAAEGLSASASLTLGGNPAAPATASFGSTYDGFTQGGTVTITEAVTGLPKRCTSVATFATSTGAAADLSGTGALSRTFTLAKETNKVAITNTVTCAELPEPTITKTAGEPVDNGDGTTSVSYEVVVSAPAGAYDEALTYQVREILPTLPAGVTLVDGWDIDQPDPFASLADQTGTITLPGEGVVGELTEGTSHAYQLTATIDIAADADLADGKVKGCEAETGPSVALLNKAVLLDGDKGSVIDHDEACAQVEVGDVEVDKTVTDISFDGDAWTVVYDVEVENTTGHGTRYDLTDTLRFAAGTDVQGVTWTGPEGDGDTWPTGATSHQLADDRYLAAGDDETYTVTVVVATTKAYPTGATGVCDGAQSGIDRAFTNEATVVSPTGSDTDRDCAEPTLPDFDKVATGAEYDAESGSWTVSYELTVDNSSGHKTVYDLADVPSYPSGVEILDGTVTDTTGEGDDDVTGSWTPGDTNPIVSGVVIAEGASHTYLVEIEVRVSDVAGDDLTCDPKGGHGYYNAATLTVGGAELPAEDCLPIDGPVRPTPSKTVTSVEPAEEPGTWVVTYDVTVTQPTVDTDDAEPINPAGVSGTYSLADELRFGDGIDVLEASWTGATSGTFTGTTAALATDRVIAAGETDTFTVTVLAEVTGAAKGKGGDLTCGDEKFPGGFLNTAELTSLGETEVVEDCAEPSVASIEKSATSTVLDVEARSWTVTWEVEVSNDGPGTEAAPYVLTEAPAALPAGFALDGDWTVTAGADTPAPNGTTAWAYGDPAWTVHTGAVESGATHTFVVTGVVKATDLSEAPAPGECGKDGGIVLRNAADVSWGDLTDEDEACTTVEFDDVSLVKTNGLPSGTTSVAPGTEFDYVLTVTNEGTRDAVDLTVTDEVPARLEVVSVTGPAGWTVGHDGNDVTATAAVLGLGESVELTVTVKVRPLADGALVGEIDDDSTLDPTVLVNEACVSAAMDDNPDNDCSTNTVETRDIQAQAQARCIAGVPHLSFRILTTANIADLPITMAWTPVDGDGNPIASAPAAQLPASIVAGQVYDVTWPGMAFSASGLPIDFPGWRPERLSDYGADGELLPGLVRWNGLVLDISELDFPWRNNTRVTFSVNPTVSLQVGYPEESATCEPALGSKVEIEKTASVRNLEPGDSFSYTLDVANTDDAGAADQVVVTDEIPADLKVDAIDTGASDALPRWDTCEVTGKDARGFGGTLTCSLQGALQSTSQPSGSSAPTITLDVTLDRESTAESVSNTGVVAYCTAAAADDCGTDSDDAVVEVGVVDDGDVPPVDTPDDPTSPLPDTGSTLSPVTLGLAALLVLAGGFLVARSRRRRA